MLISLIVVIATQDQITIFFLHVRSGLQGVILKQSLRSHILHIVIANILLVFESEEGHPHVIVIGDGDVQHF